MTTALLVVLVLCVLYLALRLHRLERAVSAFAHIVDRPRRRDRAIRKEIEELEHELEQLQDATNHGYIPDTDDFNRADEIREKLDRRLRALTGRPGTSEPPPAPSTPPTP